MPAVSVIMVFHRDTPFLRPAIESVLAQSFRDLELVLVDNGTGLPASALGGMGGDPRLKWVRLPQNEGIPGGHNAGLAVAAGEFIALLDHDDIALPSRLERQVARLRSDARLGLVSSRAETIDETGAVIGREFSLDGEGEQYRYTAYAAPVVTPAYAGRREVFVSLPYRRIFPLCADFDFLARAAERWPMAAVPEVLLRYRRHPSQATQREAARIEQQLCAVRLLTARRREGRREDAESLPAFGAVAEMPAESCRRWAGLCLSEGLGVAAAYHARRSFALQRSPGAFATAIRLGLGALAVGRAEERLLAARMFLTGPVRALRLRPA